MNTVHSVPDELDEMGPTDVDCGADTDNDVDVNVGVRIAPTKVWVGVRAPAVGVGDDTKAITVGDGVPDFAVEVSETGDCVGVRETKVFVSVIEVGMDVRVGIGVGDSTTGVLLSTGPFVGVTGCGVAVLGRRVGIV